MKAGMLGFTLATAALLAAAPQVEAHGWMNRPLARQFCNGKEAMWAVKNGGGNGLGKSKERYYGGLPGLCGDPFQVDSSKRITSNFAGMPCEAQETYQQGSIVSIDIHLSANHGGMWEISVCDRKEISQDCFDRNKLVEVSKGIPAYWIMDRTMANPKEKATGDNPEKYTVKYQLPEDLVCDHCVVQWTWWGAHICIPQECDEAVCGFYANGKNIWDPKRVWTAPVCPTMAPKFGDPPQIFRNCGDIRITPSGGTTAPEAPAAAAPEEVFAEEEEPPEETPPGERDAAELDAAESRRRKNKAQTQGANTRRKHKAQTQGANARRERKAQTPETYPVPGGAEPKSVVESSSEAASPRLSSALSMWLSSRQW